MPPGRVARAVPGHPWLILWARLRLKIWLGCALRWPGLSGVDGGLVLAGDGAFDGLEIGFELAPPSGGRLRFIVGLRLRFTIGLGVSATLEFGSGFPGGFPGAVGADGPLLVAGAVGFELLPFGGQLRGEGLGAGRAGLVMLRLGVGGFWRASASACAVRRKVPLTSSGALAWARSPVRTRASSSPRSRPRMMSISSRISRAVNTALRIVSSWALLRCGSRETACSGLVIPAASR